MDLRKGFEGLSRVVKEEFQEELISDSYFVFVNKARDRLKVLYWDVDGLAIWYKRLEKGRFPKPRNQAPTIERRELLMLLEGVTPKRVCPRYKT